MMTTRDLIGRLLASIAVLSAVFLSGCASDSLVGTSFADACARTTYDGEMMKPYGFTRWGVAVCVPLRVSATKLKGTSQIEGERVQFTGFAVPPGTNLESKELIVYLDRYPADLGSVSLGSFVFHNVKYTCTKKYERDADHVTMHVIYSGQGPTFDFVHRAVDLHTHHRGHRLAKYDEDAQIRLTRIIMRTYRELPNERIIVTCFNSVREGTR